MVTTAVTDATKTVKLVYAIKKLANVLMGVSLDILDTSVIKAGSTVIMYIVYI